VLIAIRLWNQSGAHPVGAARRKRRVQASLDSLDVVCEVAEALDASGAHGPEV